MTAVVLAVGVAAAATALVPGFDEVLRGSKIYLAVASLIGLLAAIVGVLAMVSDHMGEEPNAFFREMIGGVPGTDDT